MNTALAFRRQLSLRILAIFAVGVPSAAGCCGISMTSDPHQECFAWPQPPDTEAPVASGNATTCPTRADAESIFFDADTQLFTTVQSDGNLQNGRCCYEVVTDTRCIGGRPFLVDDQPRTAAPRRGSGSAWGAAALELEPSVVDLSPADRARLAGAWTRDGLFEHASVASFGRFALELLAVGAPAELVEGAHRAAIDEVRHARLCLALASAYAGEPVAPARFPFEGSVGVTSDLAVLAARAAREGCVGETIAAVQAAEQLARATDPAVRAALAIIAEDEARHAELAWRAVRWAIGEGGAPVRCAVAAVFAALDPEGGPVAGEPAIDDRLEAYGRLGAAAARGATTRALEEVVKPCGRALLSSVLDARPS